MNNFKYSFAARAAAHMTALWRMFERLWSWPRFIGAWRPRAPGDVDLRLQLQGDPARGALRRYLYPVLAVIVLGLVVVNSVRAHAYDDCMRPYVDSLTPYLESEGLSMGLQTLDRGCMLEPSAPNYEADADRSLPELEKRAYLDRVEGLLYEQAIRAVGRGQEQWDGLLLRRVKSVTIWQGNANRVTR